MLKTLVLNIIQVFAESSNINVFARRLGSFPHTYGFEYFISMDLKLYVLYHNTEVKRPLTIIIRGRKVNLSLNYRKSENEKKMIKKIHKTKYSYQTVSLHWWDFNQRQQNRNTNLTLPEAICNDAYINLSSCFFCSKVPNFSCKSCRALFLFHLLFENTPWSTTSA